MAILNNIRHEKYARFVAKGVSKSKAYALAGYVPSAPNASRLWRQYSTIRKRVEQLMKKDSSNLTSQDILDHVYSTFELAYESQQASAALKALELLGKERGLWRDRRENVNINLGNLSWSETEQLLRDRYGDKAGMFIDLLKRYYSNIENSSVNTGVVQVDANANHLQLEYDED